MTCLLVVAGEASGDRAAAAVVARLGARARAFGMGGAALAARGVDLVADLRGTTALGIGAVAGRAWRVLRAFRAVVRAAARRRPRAALLVDYTEFNALLAPRLRRMGTRVLWYGAPQVWAWRRGRTRALARRVDRMAVVLPFEEALWRAAGVDARYVGHPVLESEPLDRGAARTALRLGAGHAVAILPGSRPHEVRRLLEPMLEAFGRVTRDRPGTEGRVLVAASLDAPERAWVATRAARHGVPTFDAAADDGAWPWLRAFDAALCASGTASLEAALARAVPVVVYRVGPATELVARAALRTAHVALPNVLLERRAFVELLQRDVEPGRMARAVVDGLDRRAHLVASCDRIESLLRRDRQASAIVAEMLAPWLGVGGAA